ncbi:unnamed protein product [Owenia fusiformis]|uniref:Uncharacterized protein n=1 Tax=Owenia fusiformis TaxID=6347 RepID=A0A8J1TAB5_OWEFU|nr:unnamed protein product [Owenia fusiformis]
MDGFSTSLRFVTKGGSNMSRELVELNKTTPLSDCRIWKMAILDLIFKNKPNPFQEWPTFSRESKTFKNIIVFFEWGWVSSSLHTFLVRDHSPVLENTTPSAF